MVLEHSKRSVVVPKKSMAGFSDVVKSLNKKDKEIFDRFYSVSVRSSKMKIPKPMVAWIKKQFGSVSIVENQKIVDIRNKLTFEGAAFNELRSMRPKVKQKLEDKEILFESGDNFSKPRAFTPIDEFGRITGKHNVTSANVAKYDAMHSLIIFDKHNPLDVSKTELEDHFKTADKWFDVVRKKRKDYVYPFIMWNCLWKSGASIIHGHMQMLMTRDRHYPKIELLNSVKNFYKKEFNSNYFEDLINVHESLGLVKKYKKFKIVAYLTPVKDKEFLIFPENIYEKKSLIEFSEVMHFVISKLLKEGVNSFNMAAFLPPMQNSSSWKEFPAFLRITDRGNLNNKTADVGGMELYAGLNIIESDPFKLINSLD